MTKPNIKLHIQELVLHGFAPHDRYAIADAVEQELARLFTAHLSGPLLSSSLVDHSAQQRMDAGNFQVTPGANANSIGAQIAQAVHGVTTRSS